MSTADAVQRTDYIARHAEVSCTDRHPTPAQHSPLPAHASPRTHVAPVPSLLSISSSKSRPGPPQYPEGPCVVGLGAGVAMRSSYPSPSDRTSPAFRDQTISEDSGGGADMGTAAGPRLDDGTAKTSAGGATAAAQVRDTRPPSFKPTSRVLKAAATPVVMAREGQEWKNEAATSEGRAHERHTATRPASGPAVGENTAASAADLSAPHAGRLGCQNREYNDGLSTAKGDSDTASRAVALSSPPHPSSTVHHTQDRALASSPPLSRTFGGSGRMLPPIQIDWRTRSPQSRTEVLPSITDKSPRIKEMDSTSKGRPLLLSRDDIINNRSTMHTGTRASVEAKRVMRGSSVSPSSDPGLRRHDVDASARQGEYESYDELSHTDSAGSHAQKRKHVDEVREDELERASNASSLGSGTSYCSSQVNPSVRAAVGEQEHGSPRARLTTDDRQANANKRGGDAGRGDSSTNVLVQAPSNLRHPSSSTITFLATAPQRKSCDRCFKMKTKCSRAAPGASGDGPCEGCVRRGFGHDCVTSRPDFPHPRITLAKRQRREQSVPTSATSSHQQLTPQRTDSPRMRPAHLSMGYNDSIAGRHVHPQSRAAMHGHAHLQREEHASASPRPLPRHEGMTQGKGPMYSASGASLYTSIRPGDKMHYERGPYNHVAGGEANHSNPAAHYHTVIRPRARDLSYEQYRHAEHLRHSSDSFYPGGHDRAAVYDPVLLEEAGHARTASERYANHASYETSRYQSYESAHLRQHSAAEHANQPSSLTKLGTRELRDLCISATQEIVQRAVYTEQVNIKREGHAQDSSVLAAAAASIDVVLPRAITALAVEYFDTIVGPFLGRDVLAHIAGLRLQDDTGDNYLKDLVVAIGLQVQGTLLNCPARVPSKLAEGRVFKAYVESSQNEKSAETAFKVETVKSWLSGEQHLSKAVEIVKKIERVSDGRNGVNGAVRSLLLALFHSLRGDLSSALDHSSAGSRRLLVVAASRDCESGHEQSQHMESSTATVVQQLDARINYLDEMLSSCLKTEASTDAKGQVTINGVAQTKAAVSNSNQASVACDAKDMISQCPDHVSKVLFGLLDASSDDSGFASADIDVQGLHASKTKHARSTSGEEAGANFQSGPQVLQTLDAAFYTLDTKRSQLQSCVQSAIKDAADNEEQAPAQQPRNDLLLSLQAACETLRFAHDALEDASLACAYVNLCAVRLGAIAWHFAMTSVALASITSDVEGSDNGDALVIMRKGSDSLNTLVALLEAAEEREGWPYAQSLRWAQKTVVASTRKMLAMQEDSASKAQGEAQADNKSGETNKSSLDVHMAAVSSTLADNASPLAALSTLASSTPPLQTMTQRLDRKQQWLVSAVRHCMQVDSSASATNSTWLAHLLRGNPFAAQKLEQACEREMAAVVKAEHSSSMRSMVPSSSSNANAFSASNPDDIKAADTSDA